MFITVKKWDAIYISCIILVVCLFGAMLASTQAIPAANYVEEYHKTAVLLIDPGHGGEDGGAVGCDGTIESQINLEIALKTADIARLLGWRVIMTRCEDISIHDTNAVTLRQKKISDLKNRVAICETAENGILISIHQNSLPGAPSVRGAQVFYNDTRGGDVLAQTVQNSLNLAINGSQSKSAKNIGEISYLMSNVTCPAILVECGFLSNEADCKLLKTEDHQKKIALAVIASVEPVSRN